MTEALRHMDSQRHPWLEVLMAAPRSAVADLMSGRAAVFPYTRADAPDAARMLVGHLPVDDPARLALASGVSSWLQVKRAEPLPTAPARLQDFVRQVSEAFEIVSLLEMAEPAAEFREKYVRWFAWVNRLNLAPSRDARASYFRMLASTQPVVAERVVDPDGLAPFWMRLCKESGSTYPKRYLQIGLLGLRRLPGAVKRGESPWIAGLAAWALARNPSGGEFKRAWLPVKRLHPASPKVLRRRVLDVLSQKMYADADIQPPGWWTVDSDFPTTQSKSAKANVLSPPPEDYWRGILSNVQDARDLDQLDGILKKMVGIYDLYSQRTGDQYFLVRTYCSVGNAMIRNRKLDPLRSSVWAQNLARKVLAYEPSNPIAWGLWRDALFSGGVYDASVALGWETVRRFPNNPFMRTELAEILIALDQPDEALNLLESTLKTPAHNSVTDTILARLLAHKGDLEAAHSAIDDGLAIDDGNTVLLQLRALLDEGKPLPLVATARNRAVNNVGVGFHDSTIVELERSGSLRRLRQRVQSDASAVEELREILNSDPIFAYAQILAARHKLWHASEQVLPPVAASFEEALANEDLEKLIALTEQMPRLESLILLARAILGDKVAAREVADRLRNPNAADDEQAIDILRSRFQPVFELIDGGLEPADAVNKCSDQLRIAIYDTNEALSAPELLAA